MTQNNPYVRWFADLSSDDVAVVGGKNASLGEMIRSLQDEGIRVPDGFAITVAAYHAFLEANDLGSTIQARLRAVHQGCASLAQAGKELRRDVLAVGEYADVGQDRGGELGAPALSVTRGSYNTPDGPIPGVPRSLS